MRGMNLNLWNLRMLEDTVSHVAAHVQKGPRRKTTYLFESVSRLVSVDRCLHELEQSISYKTACATNEDSGQPALPHRLIRIFAVRLKTL